MYINNWAKIAKAHPSIVFYAYTKRIKEFDFTTLSALPNFILIDSFHYGRINYGKLDKAPKDAFICPEQKVQTFNVAQTAHTAWSKAKQTSKVYFLNNIKD
jgi:hypothetical protein